MLFLTSLISLLVLTTHATKDEPLCDRDLPEGAIPWMNNLTGSVVSVEWGYGKENCNSEATCLGVNGTDDVLMNVQLTPVEIQEGVKLRFVPAHMGVPYSIRPYKVSIEGFNLCNPEHGRPVTADYTSDPVTLDDSLLTVGSNYFIAISQSKLFQCRFGLRLNVTVKPNDCHYPHAPEGMMCMDHGHCVTYRTEGSYRCECCAGFTNEYCDEIDGCFDHSCANGSACVDVKQGYSGDHFACVCPDGYAGYHCEVNVNECASNPCVKGICVDQTNGYQCYCLPGYSGKHCEREYDECLSNPCQNDGFCENLVNDYRCQCPLGYTGDHCESKVDLCAINPCHEATHCQDLGHMYACVCKPGYTGVKCEININDCSPNPCHNGGTCKDLINGYKCYCPSKFTGLVCSERTFDDGPDVTELPPNHSQHIKTLYIVSGCLGTAFIIVIITMVVCVCRLQGPGPGAYDYYTDMSTPIKPKDKKSSINAENLKLSVDLSSISKPRPSVQAIYEVTTVDYKSDPMEPLVASLKPKTV
ncbi:delta and Notch-like epidermal growth factor-related receptor [Ptychodera flava]|uniref:delta and Notch-like epidermal growth factor-related receptor n=1 Tax=Ptychodera flava TaxID=63121 RepID=UPI00396A6218